MSRKTRVLFVENGIAYGGAVICLLHLVRGLDRSRFDPIIVTGRDEAPYRTIAQAATWLSLRDRRVDIPGLRRRLAGARWLERTPLLRRVALQFVARLDDLVNFLPFFLQLAWLMLRMRPDIVHGNNDPLCNRAAVLAAKVFGLPVVCHVRGDPSPTRTVTWLCALSDHLVPVSRWIAQRLASIGVAPQRNTVVYDGLDFGRLDPHADGAGFRRSYGIATDAFVVGLPGILIEWKGHRLFLEAARVLAREFTDMRFAIVGGTPDECKPFEEELRGLAARYGLADRVAFTGHVQDMSAAYCALDVVVSASTAPEPLGTVMLEALAIGRPLIAPAHGGATEIVQHERTGLLFRPNDAGALADAIRRMRSDRALTNALIARARDDVIDRFSIAQCIGHIENVYQALLAGKAAAR